MKNKTRVFAIVVLVIVVGFSLAACDTESNGSDIIPVEWQGTYGDESFGFLTVTVDGTISWTGWEWLTDGSTSGVTIVNGGTVSTDEELIGEWVYLAINSVNRGIMINVIPALADCHGFIGTGSWGASGLLAFMASYEATLSPLPNVSGFPGFPDGFEDGGSWAAKR